MYYNYYVTVWTDAHTDGGYFIVRFPQLKLDWEQLDMINARSMLMLNCYVVIAFGGQSSNQLFQCFNLKFISRPLISHKVNSKNSTITSE